MRAIIPSQCRYGVSVLSRQAQLYSTYGVVIRQARKSSPGFPGSFFPRAKCGSWLVWLTSYSVGRKEFIFNTGSGTPYGVIVKDYRLKSPFHKLSLFPPFNTVCLWNREGEQNICEKEIAEKSSEKIFEKTNQKGLTRPQTRPTILVIHLTTT